MASDVGWIDSLWFYVLFFILSECSNYIWKIHADQQAISTLLYKNHVIQHPSKWNIIVVPVWKMIQVNIKCKSKTQASNGVTRTRVIWSNNIDPYSGFAALPELLCGSEVWEHQDAAMSASSTRCQKWWWCRVCQHSCQVPWGAFLTLPVPLRCSTSSGGW
jgi:hypothetical protein